MPDSDIKFDAIAKQKTMIAIEPERHCAECGERLMGRADKKFCNDQCRTSWHNKLSIHNYQMKTINNILRKNRKILADLAAEGNTQIKSIALTRLGFDFGHFTSVRKSRGGSTAHFCYDLGYVPVSNGVYLLKTR